MKNDHADLIDAISRELAPVKRPLDIDLTASLWLVGSGIAVVLMTLLVGPIRPGALAQLLDEPRFLAETVLGVAAIVWLGLAGFRASVPGALAPRSALPGFALALLWIAMCVAGLAFPALEPSMAGKRAYCYLETFAYGVPCAAAALVLTRLRYPLRPVYAALESSLAAGIMPALFMQIACMYAPAHFLQFHLLPGAVVAVLGVSITACLRRR